MTTYKHTLDPAPCNPTFPGYKPAHQYAGKQSHGWALYKYGSHWAFNHWETSKLDEELLNGSEKCLDQHYFNLTKQHPSWDSTMLCSMTTDPTYFGEFTPTTTLHYLKPWEYNPMASWYTDETLGDGYLWWLCPFWTDLFPDKKPPATAYAMFTTYDN
jgi:hypothetical protein